MHMLEHLVGFKNILKNNKNNNNSTHNTHVANMLRTKTTTKTTPTYGINPTSSAPKHFGLMSMQLLVVLLVFLLADSGLNGLKIVTALKGKFFFVCLLPTENSINDGCVFSLKRLLEIYFIFFVVFNLS